MCYVALYSDHSLRKTKKIMHLFNHVDGTQASTWCHVSVTSSYLLGSCVKLHSTVPWAGVTSGQHRVRRHPRERRAENAQK